MGSAAHLGTVVRFKLDEDGILVGPRGKPKLGELNSIKWVHDGGEKPTLVIELDIDDSLAAASASASGSGQRQQQTSTAEGQTVEEGTQSKSTASSSLRPTPSQLENEAIQRLWETYLKLIPSRRKLDAKRRRFIRDAFRLVGEGAVEQAFIGLSRSPWHNGDNREGKKYLDVRYAIRGIGDESDDERIEKAMTWAAIYAPNRQNVDPAKVTRWLEDVRYHVGSPSASGRQRAVEAWRALRAAGFEVEKLDKSPWARIKR